MQNVNKQNLLANMAWSIGGIISFELPHSEGKSPILLDEKFMKNCTASKLIHNT